ncbi:SGNH/GDSL hydrolase family protein [Pseudarcicella hirudinis]|uniref:SGNH/GDSL hydrolase family protein n=1 Tax=Pseudarcicella hirudinis TaxID=1079859 RepID=UPI0035E5D657
MLQRIDAMKAAIAAAGRTFTPYVVVELAVNDSANHEAIGVTPSIYYDRLTNLLGRVRAKLGLSTHIIICRPWADFGYFNATIDTIVSENPYNHSVDISGAARFDGVHPNYAGNQVIGQLVISKIQSIEAVANPVIPTAPDSGGGTSTEAFRIVNTVVTDSPQYNQILVDAVPDFNIPNNTAGEPFFQIIFCTGGRNQFGLDKLYKRGFSTPTVSACVQPSEFDGSYPHANPAYVSTLPFFRRSFWTGTGWMNSAPFNLHIDAGDHTLDYFEDNGNSSYQQAILQGFGAKGYGFGDPATPNYLLNAKTILLDMENWGGFTNGLDDLEFRARHYGWLYYLMQASTSNCWVNTMYPTCPVFTFGRPNLNHYTNAGRNALWYQPVQSTSNLTAKKMPSAFVGQRWRIWQGFRPSLKRILNMKPSCQRVVLLRIKKATICQLLRTTEQILTAAIGLLRPVEIRKFNFISYCRTVKAIQLYTRFPI